MRKINEIIYDMKIQSMNHDVEVSHSDADSLLIEALEVLGSRSKFKQEIKELISIYEKMDRYYS